MKIYVAADHAGFIFRAKVIKYLTKLGHEVIDLGNAVYNAQDDYPDFAQRLAKKVLSDKQSRGVLVCGSGQGVCMAANRFRGIYGVVGLSRRSVTMARADENANVLCLGSLIMTFPKTQPIIDAWLNTKPSSAKRHQRRLAKY